MQTTTFGVGIATTLTLLVCLSSCGDSKKKVNNTKTTEEKQKAPGKRLNEVGKKGKTSTLPTTLRKDISEVKVVPSTAFEDKQKVTFTKIEVPPWLRRAASEVCNCKDTPCQKQVEENYKTKIVQFFKKNEAAIKAALKGVPPEEAGEALKQLGEDFAKVSKQLEECIVRIQGPRETPPRPSPPPPPN